MIYEPELLDLLEEQEAKEFSGPIYRHMFAQFAPDRENFRGARWNPAETSAIYTALERDTCLAEAEYYLDLQPIRPSARRTVYTISVKIEKVIDLTDWNVLERMKVSESSFAGRNFSTCQDVGGAAAWLGMGGILVPSARRQSGINLVIFQRNGGRGYEFTVENAEEL